MSQPPPAYIFVTYIGGAGTTDPLPGQHEYSYPYPTVNLTATAAPTWHFSRWIINGQTFTDNPHSVSLSMGSVYDVKAYFEQDAVVQYDLAIFQGANGTTDPPNGHYLYNVGTVVLVTALPNSGYVFDYWIKDASGTRYTNPISIVMDGNHAVTPYFKLASKPATSLSCTVNPPSGVAPLWTNILGTLSARGEQRRISVYGVYVDDAFFGYAYTDSAGNYLTYASLSAGTHNIYAVYEGDTDYQGSTSSIVVVIVAAAPPPPLYSAVTISVSGQGTTVPAAGAHTYTRGIDLTINVTAAQGWRYDHLTRNGNSQQSTVIANLAATENIVVFFVEGAPTYSHVNISVIGQGTVSPAPGDYPSTYQVATDLLIVATASTGWIYAHILRNNVSQTSLTITNLGATETIEVIFTDGQPSDHICKYGTESSGFRTTRTLPCSTKAGEIYRFEVAFATPIDPAWGALLCPALSGLYTTPSATAKCTYAYLSTTKIVLEVTITMDTIIGTDTFPVTQPTPPDTLTFTQVLDVPPDGQPDNTLYIVAAIGLAAAAGGAYYLSKRKK